MLENYSAMSGGAHNLLVPTTASGDLDSAFWPLIELFDADIWAWYVSTWRGAKMAEPENFAKWIDEQAVGLVSKHGGTVEEATRMLTEDHMMRTHRSPWPPPESIRNDIMRRTAPGFTRGGNLFHLAQADEVGGIDVTGLRLLPARLEIPDLDGLSLPHRVLAASRLGALSPSAQLRLKERGVELIHVSITVEDIAALVRFATPNRFGLAYGPGSQSRYADASAFEVSPSRLSLVGWSQVRYLDPFSHTAPLVLVVGEGVRDFCLAHALERCGVDARWLPGVHGGADDPVVRSATISLYRDAGFSGSDRPRLVTSLSLGEDSLRQIVVALRSSGFLSGNDLTLVATAAAAIPLPRRCLPALLDPGVFNETIEEPFFGEEMARAVSPAFPSVLSCDDPSALTWWVDVEDASRSLPARTALNELVVASTVGWGKNVRCGRDAISFFSHQMGLTLAGSPLAQLVERPKLRFPSARTVFHHLFEAAGFTVTESSAGHYRRLTTELWGELENLAADLSDRVVFSLLKGWLSDAPSGSVPGVLLPSRRRVLSFADVQAIGHQPDEVVRTWLDSYVERRILRRGLCLKCATCRHFDWYRLGEVEQSFECHRCSSLSVLSQASWRGGSEPAFYYDMAEVVYQALRHNAHVPVLASSAIKTRSRSFDDVSEVEVLNDGGDKQELDLLILADGRIIIGEAKVADRLGGTSREENRAIERLLSIAKRITADHVIFASAIEFRSATRSRIAATMNNAAVTWELLENLAGPD
ncbi:MAG: hypothetical protein F2534_23240 [Actinobacteria bacterium]|nr:hypothetical protein [Actinomycetota bacterium]